MQNELVIYNSIQIQATAEKVWDLLVNPQQTKKYMFGCEAISDWTIGSSLVWKGEYEGKSMDFVKGHIVQIQPFQLLVYTVIDPNNPLIPDIPENYLTVTYKLTQENTATLLEVIQGDYASVADGEKRYQDSYNNGEGWNPILVMIKQFAEVIN